MVFVFRCGFDIQSFLRSINTCCTGGRRFSASAAYIDTSIVSRIGESASVPFGLRNFDGEHQVDLPQALRRSTWMRISYCTFSGTMRGSNIKRLGLVGSIRALTQWVLRAPKVSTRVKFASTPSLGPLIGLSTLK